MSARPSPEDDAHFMTRALELARAQLGHTAPNPSVGCVLVMDNAIIGEGATGAGGRPCRAACHGGASRVPPVTR